jgi:hypothetical protein
MARKPAVGFIVWKACVNWLWVIDPVPLVSICEKSVAIFVLAASARQLWLILGDGVNQAADLASGATSIPSWNLTPWMTFGNWF